MKHDIMRARYRIPDVKIDPKRDPPDKKAVISDCRLYRYWLLRQWNWDLRCAGFIMLNPSRADHEIDDPTIKKCMLLARNWGCGGIEVVNLFAFRSTDPEGLVTAEDPVGPENDEAIRNALEHCKPLVVAWGNSVPKSHLGRVDRVMAIVKAVGMPVSCVKLNANGSPKHPLFVKGDTELVPFLQTKGA